MCDVFISYLYIELTRRCNSKCLHCAKGEAQNVDITKEIIDKTLYELQNTYINTLDIIGGESLLNIQGLSYLVDSIIKRKLKISKVAIYTNGTIKNTEIVKLIQKLSDYITNTKGIIKDDLLKYESKFDGREYRYKTDLSKKDIVVIVSTNYHNNESIIDDTITYFNKNVNRENFIALSQNEDILLDESYINYEGNVIKNLDLLSRDVLKRIRIVNNEFCIIDDSTDVKLIDKAITVSANGNVFVGNLTSYEKVDNEKKMFNILDCNKNLYGKISEWCWEHPINKKSSLIKERYMSFKWLKNKGLIDKNDNLNAYEKIDVLKYLKYYEEEIKRLHKEHPYLTHYEIEIAYNCVFLYQLSGLNISSIEKEMIIEMFSTINVFEHSFEKYSPQKLYESLNNILSDLYLKDIKRKCLYEAKK